MDRSLTTTSGHAKERFQAPQVLRPTNTITAGDLTDSAGTSLGKFHIPYWWGKATILAMGAHYAAAGGAQTTAGTAQLEVDGSALQDAAGAEFELTSVASHADGDVLTEVDLNSTTDNLSAEPSYPTVLPGQTIEMVVGTQGAGAGDQTIFPYLIVAIAPGQ